MAMSLGMPSPASPGIQILDKRDQLRNNSSSPSVMHASLPSPSHSLHQQTSSSRQTDDAQTTSQRQVAAKLALRKQLEKTLLQVSVSCF